jgi:hypothetical protein
VVGTNNLFNDWLPASGTMYSAQVTMPSVDSWTITAQVQYLHSFTYGGGTGYQQGLAGLAPGSTFTYSTSEAPASIIVNTGGNTNLAVGASRTITATVLNAFGNPLNPQPACNWFSQNTAIMTVSPQTGTSSTLTGVSQGNVNLSVECGSVQQLVQFQVASTAQTLGYVLISPSSVSISNGNYAYASAQAYDTSNSPIYSGVTYNWSVDVAGVTASSPGQTSESFASGAAEGAYPSALSVLATFGAQSTGATADIVIGGI